MISLESSRWTELNHAYGDASNIPELLKQLANFPAYENYQSEPYFSLWSSLCHQGDIYSASYAAVPHIVNTLESNPGKAHWDFFLLPASIEIARSKQNSPEIPNDLEGPYFLALSRIPSIIPKEAEREWDENYVRCVLAALAAVKGHPTLAESILELSAETLDEFQEWLENR